MDAASFRDAWERSTDQLSQFPAETLRASRLPETAKHFLEAAGLPNEAAPLLSFGPASLDWLSQTGDKHDRVYPVGSDASGNPIVVDEHGAVWLIDHEVPTAKSLVNSSVPALAECLLAYRALIAEVIAVEGEDAWLDGRIPKALIEAFSRSINAIDASATQQATFWGDEVSRLLSDAA